MCFLWIRRQSVGSWGIYPCPVMGSKGLTNYLETEINCDKDIVIYNDGCGSQNRNATLSNALSVLARTKGVPIVQKYLEKGHTKMECDSVHSVIERQKKHRDLHSPAQYVQLIKESQCKKTARSPLRSAWLFQGLKQRTNVLINQTRTESWRSYRGWPSEYLPSGDIQWKLRHTDEWQLLLQPRRAAIHECNDANTKPCVICLSAPKNASIVHESK